jgi:putative tryptophan/tyrosine transport system substrate-binding protein
VGLKVDVIVTGGSAPTRAAKEATSLIPIVMAQDNDPVAAGIVSSLARPGGNITGLSNFSPELAGKRLEILKEVVPKLSRVALLGDPIGPSQAQVMKVLEPFAKTFDVQLQYLDVLEPRISRLHFEPQSRSVLTESSLWRALTLFLNEHRL